MPSITFFLKFVLKGIIKISTLLVIFCELPDWLAGFLVTMRNVDLDFWKLENPCLYVLF